MPNAIWKKIADGKIDHVYLLTGVEHHIFDQTIERLKRAIPDVDDETIIRFDLDQTPLEVVLEEADTLPFLQDQKLIIANDAYFLTGQDRKKTDVEHNVQALEDWLEHPSPTATVVFIAPYEKLDGRKKITKKIKQYATVIEANRLEGKDLSVWIQQEAQANGVHITNDTAQKLVQTVGENLLTLATEIQKMATYLGEPADITDDLIDMMVPRTPEMDVFRLTDAFVANRVSESVAIYHDLLRNGEEPIMLTSLIAGQVRLMIHVQSLSKKGYNQPQIAKTLRVHPYRVKLMLQNRALPNPKRLLHILEELAEIDFKLKSTSGKRERLLELFFMNGL
ncbi:MAG TPA: DNA polymerase III subunit delta [Sporosarcina sp.]|nr:DNA polymerase III subunit delta [Sporosarcina sp.]